jgi:hypothetical protein
MFARTAKKETVDKNIDLLPFALALLTLSAQQ